MNSELKSDPFTITIIKNALKSISEEMFSTTARSAQSPIIYDVLDFSTCITDSQGNVISQATGIPLFIGVFDYTVKGIIDHYKNENIEPGDIIITNDPYISGTHLNDVALIAPIFYKDTIVAYAASKGHWLDIGGMSFGSWGPGRSEIFQEGLFIPPCKLYKANKLNLDIVKILKSNSRLPNILIGDMEAQIAGLRIANTRILRLIDKYGLASFFTSIEKILNDGKYIANRRLKEIPNGLYEAVDYLDEEDENGHKIKIHAQIKITENEFIVDFTNNPNQLPFSMNTTYPATVAAVRVVYMSIIDPHIVFNQGIVSPLKVIAPRGTIFNAIKPAPVSVYWESLSYAADLVWKAVAPVVKEKITAGHFLSVVAEIIAGINNKNNEPFALVEPNPGGWGAGIDKDGESALVSFADGETYASSVEILERRYPIMVERYCLNIEDGVGHGKYRGGFGIIKDYRILNDVTELTTDINRSIVPPWGIEGGENGTGNYIVIIRNCKEILRTRKISSFKLLRNDIVSIRTGGGGGWGNPFLRDPKMVLEDVKNGFIDIKTAKEKYLVIINPTTMEIDWKETDMLRNKFQL